MKQSVKSQLLYELFLYPGNEAKYYKERLALSDATFARMIAQLKEDLKSFDAHIVITNGYRIRGENEAYVGMLFTQLLVFFRWDIQMLFKEVEVVVGKQELEKLLGLNFSRYIFTEDTYEVRYFHVACAIALLRQYQRKSSTQWTDDLSCDVTIDKIVTYFEEVYDEALAEIEHAELTPYTGVYSSKMISGDQERLKQLIVLTTFQIKLFPYDMGRVPLRTNYFIRKMFHTNPARALFIRTIIYRAKEYYRVDFDLRLSMVVYFLVTEDLIHFEKIRPLKVYVYSNLGKNHQRYLISQISQIQGFFHSQLELESYEEQCKEVGDKK